MAEQKKDIATEAVHNVQYWLKQNEKSFKPPICNKLMYGKQLKVMFVGGPNARKDFHIDCGEEFFYQIKGNMQLITYQRGHRKIVNIKEGQIYLLRSRIPHSPQRLEQNSIGLVIERKRLKRKKEYDCLRYYCCDFDEKEQNETKILFEKWFHCKNVEKDFTPIIDEFKNSDAFKTKQPQLIKEDDNNNNAKKKKKKYSVEIDNETLIDDPIDLFPYIESNQNYLLKHKRIDIYTGTQTTLRIMTGPFEYRKKFNQETWIYCLKGNECRIGFDYPSKRDTQLLSFGDCLLVHSNEQYKITIPNNNTLVMTVSIDIGPPIEDPKALPTKYDHEKKKDMPWENMKSEDPKYKQRLKMRYKDKIIPANIDNDILLDQN